MFSRVGAAAYKADLTNTIALCEALGNPQHQFKSIHIAGTNGKGSTVAYLAALCGAMGQRHGTYTSPHIFRFNERICIMGEAASLKVRGAASVATYRARVVDPDTGRKRLSPARRHFCRKCSSALWVTKRDPR